MRKLNPIPKGASIITPKINYWSKETVIKNNGIKKTIYRKNGRQKDIFGRKLKKNKEGNNKILCSKVRFNPYKYNLERHPYYIKKKQHLKKRYIDGPLITLN